LSFEVSYVVPSDKTAPDVSQMEMAISKLPYTTREEDPQESEWGFEYLNPETGVTCSFRYAAPSPTGFAAGRPRESGLKASLPLMCPTFIGRETCPIVEQLGRSLNLGALLLASGDYIEDCDAGRLQVIWNESNRAATEKLGIGTGRLPPYFPRERLDEMWRYMNARKLLETRYSAKGIYVPRVILIQNKLDRKQTFMAAMWAEMGPAVFPEVDSFVIGKPIKTLLGLINTGDFIPVVVRAKTVMKHVEPRLRHVDRPIAHRILENAGPVRGPILRSMNDVLTPPFRNFETLGVEEVVDNRI
jgi:hypothetical protein